MPNGAQHESLTRAALVLLRRKRGEFSTQMIHGSSAPDHAVDVFVHMPNGARVTSVLGREVTALQHFLPGFCWQNDPSLSVLEEIGDLGAKVLNMVVSGNSVPMVRALRNQPRRTLCELRFPSAADVGGYHAAVADGDPYIIGMACHMIQDCAQPHHATGRLLGGHQKWEDQAEQLWRQHVEMLMMAPEMIFDTLGAAVAKEQFSATSVEELCEENAEWSRRWFAKRDITECTINDALAISVRAVAATMRGIQLMTASVS
jgi:hypothetical protein